MKSIHNQPNQNEKLSLCKIAGVEYAEFTTFFEGNRNPYSSGLFLSTIYHSSKWETPTLKGVIHSLKLVAWAILGNKAIRTNNQSRSKTVVEPTLHPYTVQHSLLTNFFETTMKSYIFKFLSLTTGKITQPIISTSEAEARKKAGENDRLTMIYRKPNPFPILSHACPMAFANWGVWYA